MDSSDAATATGSGGRGAAAGATGATGSSAATNSDTTGTGGNSGDAASTAGTSAVGTSGGPGSTSAGSVGTGTGGDACSDGIRDGEESDVDCGGSCARCPIGEGCTRAADCLSGSCVSGRCGSPGPCPNLSYAPIVSVDVGVGPTTLAAADFNEDGWPDLAVANDGGNSVSIVLGYRDGGFAPEVEFPVGKGPMSVALGDFDLDGHTDIAVANFGDGTVSLLFGTGAGTFGRVTSFACGEAPQSIAAGDFNGDGLLDLAVGNLFDGSVGVFLASAPGQFGTPVVYPLPADFGPDSIVVGDFTGDGIIDLAVAGLWTTPVVVLPGLGDGNFGPPITHNGVAHAVAAADFDFDGILDLAAVNAGVLDIFLSDGGEQGTVLPYQAQAVLALDLNGDGRPDAVSANGYPDNSVAVLLGNGRGSSGQFDAPSSYSVGNFPTGLAAADFNGDGYPDIAVANQWSSQISVLMSRCRSCSGCVDAAGQCHPGTEVTACGAPETTCQVCQSGTSCTGGSCTGCGGAGWRCNGSCVDVNSDPANCGSCGHVCSGSCTNGSCT